MYLSKEHFSSTKLRDVHRYKDVSGAFTNIGPKTKRADFGRSILDSVAFRAHQLLGLLVAETGIEITKISVNGGISKNEHICQTISNLQKKNLVRASDPEVWVCFFFKLCFQQKRTLFTASARGAAFLASRTYEDNETFETITIKHKKDDHYESLYKNWLKAVDKIIN